MQNLVQVLECQAPENPLVWYQRGKQQLQNHQPFPHQNSSHPPPVPPSRRFSTTTVHNTPLTMRYAAISSAKNVYLALSNQASVDVVKQNDVKPKTKYAKMAVGELSSKAENVTTRLTTPKATCKKGKK